MSNFLSMEKQQIKGKTLYIASNFIPYEDISLYRLYSCQTLLSMSWSSFVHLLSVNVKLH